MPPGSRADASDPGGSARLGPDRPPLAIIGGGRVGQTLGRIWLERGWPIVAVTCRDATHASSAAAFIKTTAAADNVAAAELARILIVTTSDGAVAPTVEALADAGAIRADHVVLHTSGALQLIALDAAREAGAAVGSIHPIHSFAAPVSDPGRLAGVVWGVTAEPAARDMALRLVADAGGEPAEVDDADRAVYHAAAAVASNATVGVLGFAIALLKSCGFADDLAERALLALARQTLDNVKEMGIIDALTGPVVRGDIDTVARHLAALGSREGEAAEDYRVLSRLVLEVAKNRGTLTGEQIASLERLLGPEARS